MGHEAAFFLVVLLSVLQKTMIVKLLPRPVYQTDGRPELWTTSENKTFLVYLPYVITSEVMRHGLSECGLYECVTRNSVYRFDWAPTMRRTTWERLGSVRRRFLCA